MLKRVAWIVAMLVVVGAVALGWAYSGQYNVAADAPHWDVTTRALATIRERSIAAHAADERMAHVEGHERLAVEPRPMGAARSGQCAGLAAALLRFGSRILPGQDFVYRSAHIPSG